MGSSVITPPNIKFSLHEINRVSLLNSLLKHLSLSLSSRPTNGFVFLQGGEEQYRHCTDHAELFRNRKFLIKKLFSKFYDLIVSGNLTNNYYFTYFDSACRNIQFFNVKESYFAYLFGVREPGFYAAIDISNGESILFAPRLPSEYAVWLGEIQPLSYFKENYMVNKVFYTDEIVKFLLDHCQGSKKPLLFLLHGLNTDSNNYSKPAHFEGIEKFKTDLTTLHPILTECRVFKSDMEIDLIQFANDISSEAHVEVMRSAKVGMKEYQLESMFLHHTYMYGGCRHCSYTCICATGDNSSVLHYGHAAAPNDKILHDGDMALLDMGAEYHFYGSDITCSFPVNGKFTSDQCLVYNAVLDAHNAVISSMKPGVSWVDMHKLAEKTVLESLKQGEILIGDIDEMMAERVGAVFMPHGLGHFLGIDTHDPGGYLQGAKRSDESGLKSLRTSRELQAGMVITVEPGCYFIDALLKPAMGSSKTSKFFNDEEINRFRGFGGVRIESDVRITADGCVNMTNVPRQTREIEAVMAGKAWPLK